MANTNIVKYNSRVVMKHDSKANWDKATNFIPLKGEFIVYDDTQQIKIGDGTTKVGSLPFINGARLTITSGATEFGMSVEGRTITAKGPKITYDAFGRITKVETITVTATVPDADTLNTTGASDSDVKLFLVGAPKQEENPITYSDNEVFVTNGVLTTRKTQVGGGKATLEYDSTAQALKFVFE